MAHGIQGLDKLMRKYGELGTRIVNESMENAVNASTKTVQASAKLLCPVNHGELKRNIRTMVQRQDDKTIGVVYNNVPHAMYVEFGTGPVGEANHGGISPAVTPAYSQHGWGIPGDAVESSDVEKYHWPERTYDGQTYYMTSGQPAQPFMYPALKDNEERVTRNISNYLAREIRKVCK